LPLASYTNGQGSFKTVHCLDAKCTAADPPTGPYPISNAFFLNMAIGPVSNPLVGVSVCQTVECTNPECTTYNPPFSLTNAYCGYPHDVAIGMNE